MEFAKNMGKNLNTAIPATWMMLGVRRNLQTLSENRWSNSGYTNSTSLVQTLVDGAIC